ncbi:uncharacterized protein LOC130956573 [Arachis stenosperma]|uniref:uncharacterized protein LOC130956573 n=1 Tax=Arachis stenosperma TaxID=217475 RepID=UPI0025ABD4D5|nr:uncharacterized protein LOC130956573 [Arachis stenosperma]XP_057739602.1 uncharacterized protein LOC130956573 [Arachis stenosperma]
MENRMELHAIQRNGNIICNISKQAIEETRETESDERKNVKEFSSYTDETRTISVPDISGEFSLKLSRMCLTGGRIGCLKKKLLILDINGLLADVVSPRPKDHKADRIVAGRAIFQRPFYTEFLKFCFEKFEVAVWSSRKKKNVQRILDYLMADMKEKLLFYWDASHCTGTNVRTMENKHKKVLFKDLRNVWEKRYPNLPWEKGYFNESNTLLLDDSPYKALLNPPHTSVFPLSFSYQNKSDDNSLADGGDLREYLNGLVNVESIPNYVEEHPFGQEPITKTSPSWNFYLQVLDSLFASQLEDNVSANLNNQVHSSY